MNLKYLMKLLPMKMMPGEQLKRLRGSIDNEGENKNYQVINK
jgi:hypothetical protein